MKYINKIAKRCWGFIRIYKGLINSFNRKTNVNFRGFIKFLIHRNYIISCWHAFYKFVKTPAGLFSFLAFVLALWSFIINLSDHISTQIDNNQAPLFYEVKQISIQDIEKEIPHIKVISKLKNTEHDTLNVGSSTNKPNVVLTNNSIETKSEKYDPIINSVFEENTTKTSMPKLTKISIGSASDSKKVHLDSILSWLSFALDSLVLHSLVDSLYFSNFEDTTFLDVTLNSPERTLSFTVSNEIVSIVKVDLYSHNISSNITNVSINSEKEIISWYSIDGVGVANHYAKVTKSSIDKKVIELNLGNMQKMSKRTLLLIFRGPVIIEDLKVKFWNDEGIGVPIIHPSHWYDPLIRLLKKRRKGGAGGDEHHFFRGHNNSKFTGNEDHDISHGGIGMFKLPLK